MSKRVLFIIAIIAVVILAVALTQYDSSNAASTADANAALSMDEPAHGSAEAHTLPAIAFDPAITTAPDPLLPYGPEIAPLIMSEFASFTCSHCADFHQTILPALLDGPLADNTARLNGNSFIRNEPDLRATQLLACIGNPPARHRFADVLYELQERWAFSSAPIDALRNIAIVGGIDGAQFDSCMANSTLEEALIAQRQVFEEKFSILGTPTLYIGDVKYTGSQTPGAILQAIDDAAQTAGQ